MDKIFIEGQQVDSSDIFTTKVSYVIDDIKDFGFKNCSLSKTIIVPATKHNNKIFGNIYKIEALNDYDPTKPNINLNFNASVKARCVVYRDNMQAIKGVMQLLSISIDRGLIDYEISITGELGGFVLALGSSKLEALDFSAYNHTYNLVNIVGSKANVGSGSGYIYPHIDYGTYSTDKHHWSVKTFRPALHVKEYIDKIMSAAGYTFEGDIFNSSRFKSLIIPYNKKILIRKGSDILTMDAPYQLYNNANPGTTLVDFSGLITLFNFTTSDNQTFTYSGSDTFNGTISVQLLIQYIGIGGATFNLYKNGTIVSSAYRTAGTYNFTISASVGLVAGDYIEVEYLMPPHRTLVINDGKLTAVGGLLYPIPVSLNRPIIMNDCIPSNILQKDFITWICKLFNLYIYEDTFKDKHLIFKPFSSDGVTDGFYKLGEVEDWSSYLDRSSAIKIKPMSELNARYYLYNFKDDSDFYNDLYKKRYNKSYGSYKYDSQYQFSKESETIEIGFSGTPLIGYNGEDKVYSTIMKRTGTDALPVEDTTDSNIRILQTKLVSGVSSWNIIAEDGVSVLGSYTNYLYAGHFDDPDTPTNDIHFGVPDELFFTLLTGSINVNQFNVYWSSYLAEITDKDARLVTATFKLPLRVISNLDFSKYKYIDGCLYRLNKIIDYNVSREDSCSCELIKVINKIY